MVQTAIPHPVRFMMTEGIYRIPAMRWFFKLWDTIPVPDGDAVKVSAMKEAPSRRPRRKAARDLSRGRDLA